MKISSAPIYYSHGKTTICKGKGIPFKEDEEAHRYEERDARRKEDKGEEADLASPVFGPIYQREINTGPFSKGLLSCLHTC